MSTRKYVQITAEEMVEELAKYGLVESKPVSGERIFVREYDNGTALMIFSSLPVFGEVVRERGADAIRIVARNNKTGNHRKGGKVLRIDSWRSNLREKIFETLAKYGLHDTPRCVECGSAEVNGQTWEGEDVCAHHQIHVFRGNEIVSLRVMAWGA